MTTTDGQQAMLGKGYPYTLRPELHKALKVRGVDYWVAQGLTFWNCPDGRECVAYGYQSNGKPRLTVKIAGLTDPAQAIAATLGGEDTYTREDVEGAFVSGYSLGLDMFDSSKPEKGWNQNERNMDEEMEDLGWVRKDAATLGAGTCHITPKFTCSECGHQYPTRNYESYETCDGRTAFAPLGHYVLDCKKPNYCPNCGRKVTS